ncbi:hypothetical protein BG011_009798 [Mortierella polycephala]|uniref:BAG domain-containing protein n=1 Tax=Mortierella polycephala TaxID=41804 RepID=A0A9P6PNK5_9FUNG|nr:hypothetical protein BG011_009798 [Mortierella polycephala]
MDNNNTNLTQGRLTTNNITPTQVLTSVNTLMRDLLPNLSSQMIHLVPGPKDQRPMESIPHMLRHHSHRMIQAWVVHTLHIRTVTEGPSREYMATVLEGIRDHPRSPPPSSSQQYFSHEQYPPPPHPSHRHQGSFDENAPKGAQLSPEVGAPPVGDSSSGSHRGSVLKHPLSPMDHSQPHASNPSHPIPSPVQHHYAEQHRRNHLVAMGGPPESEEASRRFSPPEAYGHNRRGMATSSPPSQPHPASDPTASIRTLPMTPGAEHNVNPNPHDLVPQTVKQLESRLHFVEDAYMSLRQFAQELQNIQMSQDQTIAWMRDRIDQLSDAGAQREMIASSPLPQAGVVPSKRKAEYSPGEQRDLYRHAGPNSGLPPSGPPPHPSPPVHGSGPQGPTAPGRYESSGFHPSFKPIHHPSQTAPPPPQYQHPSPPMTANNVHYQKPSLTNIVHHEQYDPETVLNIRWNDEKYTIDFQGRILGHVKLGELRKICKDLTDIPLGGLTLLHGEATLKDENAPLSCFGIKAGARITVKGVKPTPEQIKELTTNGDPEEYALIFRISGSLEKSKDFVSEYLPKYEQEVESYLASKPGPFAMAAMPPGRKKLHDLHGMMSECLLQSLLALDGVTCQPEFEVARVKRRGAVKETQRLLDVIDAINMRVKENDKAARL